MEFLRVVCRCLRLRAPACSAGPTNTGAQLKSMQAASFPGPNTYLLGPLETVMFGGVLHTQTLRTPVS